MGTKRTIKAQKVYTTIQESFDAFKEEKISVGRSKATVENYETTYNIFCRFFELDTNQPIESIEKSMLYEFSGELRAEDKPITTINHYLRDLRTWLNFCMEREWLPSYKITLISGQESQLKLFSDEEIQELMVKPKKGDSFVEWRTYCIVNWVLATGNRASTICSIQVSDINFTRKEITLPHTKNKKAQVIPLSAGLETVLKEYMRMWGRTSGYLFCDVGEGPLTTNALRQSFRKYCLDRGVSHTNIHGLRHNFAKYWVQNNGNMFILQKILGHSSLDMTRRYVSLFTNDLKENYEDFVALDTLKKSKSRRQTISRVED